MNYENGLSASDVALLANRGGNNNDGFGDNGSWWVIIFLIFAFVGWGGRGFGNNGNGTSGATDNYVLASDFAQLSRQLDSGFDRLTQSATNINNGLCDGFYAVNTAFGNLNTNLCSQFGNVTNAITQNGYESRLATQNLASDMASCCCDVKEAIQGVNYNNAQNTNTISREIADVNYNMATNTCALNNNITSSTNAIQNSMCTNTRDIIDSQTNGTRAILDAITANRLEDKNAQITAQQNEINALRLTASQQAQNNYLVNQLRPSPVPAFTVPAPYMYGNYGCNSCGNY